MICLRRKIIPHGPSSLTVSLPSAWVKLHNLKKGQELDISEEENHLLIKPISAGNNSKNAEISLSGLGPETWKDMLLALHKKGYDEIKINGSQNIVKELHAYLSSMQLGFEIIKQELDSILIRNISNPNAEEFDTLFRRILWISLEYSNKIKAIINSREDITNSCLLHETSITRISNYCKRIIVKEKRTNSCFLYSILKEINTIVHSLTALLAELKEIDEPVSKIFIAAYHETDEMISKIYDLYYKFSLNDYVMAKKNLVSMKKQITQTKSKESNSGYWDHLDSINNSTFSLLESMLLVHY